jgi:hypothetical protein
MKWLSTGSEKDNDAIEKTAIESLSFEISLAEKEMLENAILNKNEEITQLYKTGDIDLAYKKSGEFLDLVERYNKIARCYTITQHPEYNEFKKEYKDYELE